MTNTRGAAPVRRESRALSCLSGGDCSPLATPHQNSSLSLYLVLSSHLFSRKWRAIGRQPKPNLGADNKSFLLFTNFKQLVSKPLVSLSHTLSLSLFPFSLLPPLPLRHDPFPPLQWSATHADAEAAPGAPTAATSDDEDEAVPPMAAAAARAAAAAALGWPRSVAVQVAFESNRNVATICICCIGAGGESGRLQAV
jgi:hypothetical protein